MIHTDAIKQFDSKIDGVFAFRVTSEVGREDMSAMAQVMNDAFDRFDEVDMLICFENNDGAQLGAGLSAEAAKAQFRAISKIRNYCVVNAPEGAENLIAMFDAIMPVDAQTFASEHNALEHLRTQSDVKKHAA